ncbi:MAG: diguanylate cyclase [Phormidium tanganyikae FI6-MK23]|nr:diguanylate cyclase [Phormidium tanganyikae FI6-MK23]
MAQTLQRRVRRLDLVARYGGEEFAVILPGTLIGAATRVAERILKRIREMNLPH